MFRCPSHWVPRLTHSAICSIFHCRSSTKHSSGRVRSRMLASVFGSFVNCPPSLVLVMDFVTEAMQFSMSRSSQVIAISSPRLKV